MIKTLKGFVAFLLLFAILIMPGCNKKESDVSFTSLTANGSFIAGGPNFDATLRFFATVINEGEIGATITEWVAEIKAGNTVVITVSKTNPGIYSSAITPSASSTYTVSAGATFDFDLNKKWVINVPDPYNGYNPDSIKLTITVEDENGETYTVEMTSEFSFFRG